MTAPSARSRWSPSSRAIPAPPPISYIERSGGLYRDMMIHDFDLARFLLGEEPVEVHAIGSVAGRPGDRQGRRRRHRHGDAADGLRQALPDLLLAPRRLRLRPAGRGARLKGMLRAGNIHETDGRGGDQGGLHQRPGRSTSSSSATPTPTGWSSPPSSTRSRPAGAVALRP